MIYLDNAASTAPLKTIIETLKEDIEFTYFNPSSSHVGGFRSARILSKSRETVARAAGINPEELYFTSGATESNNIIFRSTVSRLKKEDNIVISPVEHPSMERCAEYFRRHDIIIRKAPCDKGGKMTPEGLAEVMDKNTALFAFIHINNETGIIQDADALIKKARSLSPGIHIHTDAVQSFCKIPGNLPAADTISISAHKIHGLKGTGGLIIKKGTVVHPLMFGGGQERGLRPGTENITGITAFAHSAAALSKEAEKHYRNVSSLAQMLDQFCRRGIYSANREKGSFYSPYIYSMAHPAIPGAVIQNALSERGIYVSTGSACSDKKSGSPVLTAMKYEKARTLNTIRISFSVFSSMKDTETLITALEEIHEKYNSVYEMLKK